MRGLPGRPSATSPTFAVHGLSRREDNISHQTVAGIVHIGTKATVWWGEMAAAFVIPLATHRR